MNSIIRHIFGLVKCLECHFATGLHFRLNREKITFAMCHFANYLAELFPLRPPSAATGVPLPARSQMRARAVIIRYERNAQATPKSAPPAAVPKVCPQISRPR